MTDKERFDALEVLRNAAHQNFEERRRIEWKVCLALWTALAVLAGFLLKNENPSSFQFLHFWIVSIFIVAVILVHWFWEYRLAVQHNIDRKIEWQVTKDMRSVIGFELSQEIEDEISKRSKENRFLHYYGVTFKVCVTVLLGLVILCVMLANFGSSSSQSKKSSQETNVVNTTTFINKGKVVVNGK